MVVFAAIHEWYLFKRFKMVTARVRVAKERMAPSDIQKAVYYIRSVLFGMFIKFI